MKKYSNKIVEYLPYIFILVVCFPIIVRVIGNADELWNYNFAKNIAEGKIPYKDISMIQTPLSAYIAAVFMCVFGKGIIVFRLLTYIIMTSTYIILFRLCKKVTSDTEIALICTMICFIFNYMWYIYNYNYLSVLVILIIMYIEISNKCLIYRYKGNIMLGILYGILPLIKQNTGGVIFVVHIIICLLDYFIYQASNKKIVVCKVISSMIPGMAFIIYMLCSGSFWDFMEYAVLGIGSFVHKVSYWNYYVQGPINFILAFLPVGMILCVLYFFIVKKQVVREKLVIFAIAISWFWIVIYPLCDYSHLFIGYVPLFPMVACVCDFSKIKAIIKTVINTAIITCSIMLAVVTLPIGDEYKIASLNDYKGVFINKEKEEYICKVKDYIIDCKSNGIQVYIANAYAVAYTVTLDEYKKNWDMLLVGNIGATTTQELLDVEKDALFLVLKDEFKLNMQDHYELIKYIKDNYEKVDEVVNFDVYRKKG